MSRKPVVRSLPPLESLFPKFPPFKETDNKRHLLEEHLRKAAMTLQTNERTAFYSMRDVAEFFRVSLKSVAVVYERLKKEALLTVVRGSKTMLEGRLSVPKVGIRGVVGIPIHLPSFIYGSNPRDFYIHLEDELRRQSYVADFIFYASREIGTHSLVAKLLLHEMDILFWLAPAPRFSEALLRLQDAGVQLVVVSDGETTFPVPHQYVLNLDTGFEEAAVGWKSEGLEEVFLIGPKVELASHFRPKCKAAFKAQGFQTHDVRSAPEEFFESAPGFLKHPKAGMVFLEHFHYEALCNYDWRMMTKIFKTKRSLLAQGLVFHPAFVGQHISVDTSELAFNRIARSISVDISQRKYATPAEPTVFSSSWHPNCDLGNVRAIWGI